MADDKFGFNPRGNSDDDSENNQNNRDNESENPQGNDPFANFFGGTFGGSNSGPGGSGGGSGADFNIFGIPLFGGMPGGANSNSGTGAGNSGAGSQPNLGDILNQFGQMLSGMGQNLESSGPVNYSIAQRVAAQNLGSANPVRDSQHTAASDAVRLSELWLDDATALPAGANRTEAWNKKQWLEHTMPTWQRLVDPIAKRMAEASTEAVPEEARQMIGPMLQMMNQMNAASYGTQLGAALADLAKTSLTSTDLGLPLYVTEAAVLLPGHISDAAEELELSGRELMVYAAAREAAHQRLYHHVPWLVERMLSSVAEYADGLVIDYSSMEEAARSIDPEALQDPSRIQEAMANMQNMDLSPKISSVNQRARSRFETLLALVEGWVEVVVSDALSERLPGFAQIDEAWRRRSVTQNVEATLQKVTGIDLGAPKIRAATDLWRRLEVAVGTKRRDEVWDHPDFLPVAEDLDDSAAFIDSVLGGNESDDFDPIAELEEQLRKESDEADSDKDGEDNREN